MKPLLIFLLMLCSFFATAQKNNEQSIRLNQLGFYPHAPKIAIVITKDSADAGFSVVSVNNNKVVYSGKLSTLQQSANSSLKTRTADFSKLKTPGKYFIAIKGLANSYPFTIANKVNHAAAVASLKGYYYQRVSMPLFEKYAGKWARPAGHPDTAVLIHASAATTQRPEGTMISCPGGWYDAGDYNKYIVNSGITMGTLLSAYEDFSRYFDTLKTNIPEEGNGVPDILNEIIYNLRWMLTMQDPNDGGVYNKCTNAAFDGMVMPGVTKLPRYVVKKGTAATLDFAAVTAQAARILKKFSQQLPGLADSCQKAALAAWQWALKNPNVRYDQNAMNKQFSPKITTGGYGDNRFVDEGCWAAAELFATTKDGQYLYELRKYINDPMTLPNWGNVYGLGIYTLLRNSEALDLSASETSMLKKKVLSFANAYVESIPANAFKTVMGKSKTDFNWGSNSNAANQGIALVNAYIISKDKKYLDAALTNLDYLLGRNATGFCFLTGVGTKSTMNPHHRPSVADGIAEPVPGLLAGGPNPARQDGCKYEFLEPETCYLDESCSYASNEIAINWNAPMVYLANAIEALQAKF
jgi:endoglucanase